jgi:signal transduction histidine kinase
LVIKGFMLIEGQLEGLSRPYQQVVDNAYQHFRGAGLGLYITRQLITLQGAI